MLMVSSTAPASTLSAHSLKMEDLSLTALAPRTVSTSRPGHTQGGDVVFINALDAQGYFKKEFFLSLYLDKRPLSLPRCYSPSMRKSQTGWQVPWKAARSGMLSALAETNTMSVESVSHPA